MTTKTDVLIIGGGVIGVCAAYYLAEQGRSVTLVEKKDICAGSSYGNAGWLAYSYVLPIPMPGALSQGLKWLLDSSSPFYIKPRFNLDLLRWLWQFQAACTQDKVDQAIPPLTALNQLNETLYAELMANEALDCNYTHEGLLRLFTRQDDFKSGLKKAKTLQANGMEVSILDLEGVRRLESNVSSAVRGGIYIPKHAHLTPGHFVRGLAEAVQARGVEIKLGVEVVDFETVNAQITKVVTSRGDIEADQVILAAGAWSTPLAKKIGIHVPMQPAKGYALIFERPEICPQCPLSLADVVAVTPMGDKLRCSSTFELVGFDGSINQRRVNAIEKMAHQYLDGLGDLNRVETWSGFRPATSDSLPIIGRSEIIKNLVIATGHAMLGITQGPGTGKLVAQLVEEEQPVIDLMAFRAERF